MTGIAMAVVLVSAMLHAGWNFLAKKSTRKVVFIWWFLLGSTVLYFPMFVCVLPHTTITLSGWVSIAASGAVHFLYFFFLGRAYERGDLSLVYPLSRAIAPVVVALFATAFVNERLHVAGWGAVLLVVAGIFIIHLRSFSKTALFEPLAALRGEASVWAILTGLAIATYSLVDKTGARLVEPPVYIYLINIVTWLLLSPFVLMTETGRIMAEWRKNRLAIVAVAVLVTASYLLILFALRMANVSYVVAVREVSIVCSVAFGIIRLKERYGTQKLMGSILIIIGVVTIGLIG
jgi:uncharacterized membrane protein